MASSLSMFRGRTVFVTETVGPTGLGSNGIQGWQFWLTAKYDAGDGDPAAVFQKLPGSWNITQNGNANTPGIAVCTLSPADSINLPPYAVVLAFDVTAVDTNGNKFSVDSGTITVTPDITLVA